MKPAVMTLGAAGLALGLAAAAPAEAGSGLPPPYGVWGGPAGADGRPVAWIGPSWVGRLLGHGPVCCYYTRVRVDNAWRRAQICDWY